MGASIYFGLLALGTLLSAPLAAVGAAIGDGLVFASYLQGIARQPAMEAKLRLWMFICFGILETPFIISLVFFFVFMGKLPAGSTQDVINMFGGAH